MTVDLLPARSAPAAPTPDETADGARPSRNLVGGRHGWADVEQDCHYCAGPETD